MPMRKPEDLHETEASRQRVILIGCEAEPWGSNYFLYRKTDCGVICRGFLFGYPAEAAKAKDIDPELRV